MKGKNFFKQLDSELEEFTPPVSDKLKNCPIVTQGEDQEEFAPALQTAGGGTVNGGKRSSIISLVVAFVLVCAVFLCILFTFNKSDNYSLMVIDINPQVECVLDEDYNVVNAVSGNTDGDILLSGGFADSLEGLSCTDAAVAVTERAANLGYIDVLNEGSGDSYNKVNITLESSSENKSLAEEISSGVTTYFCEKGVYLYANVTSVADSAAKNVAATLAGAKTFYWERIEESSALAECVKQYAYSYVEELLSQTLESYDAGDRSCIAEEDEEGLRTILSEGVTSVTFDSIENDLLLLKYFSNELLFTVIAGFLDNIDILIENTYSLLESRAEAALQKYSAVYVALSQQPITAEAYEDFLQRIEI